MLALNKIYLIVPKLIEQPTWGGKYILEFKGWSQNKLFKDLKIGQSYELFSSTKLRSEINNSEDASFTGELGYAMEPNRVVYQGSRETVIALKELVKVNPEAILGTKANRLFNGKIKTLIKFTQALGNSFQIHIRENEANSRWRFKPESWYYFEPGLLTLGVRNNIDWNEYEKCCLDIEKEMQKISLRVKRNELDYQKAISLAQKTVKQFNPWQFVNLVKAKKDDLVDLSFGGVHHSWEESSHFPKGIIVYELSLDEMDPLSTIRCFDKGKIKKDGSLRKIDIADYFKHIDRSKANNQPGKHFFTAKTKEKGDGYKIESLLETKFYSLERLTINSFYNGKATVLDGSYHHLFVKNGAIALKSENSKMTLTKGHSCFIPAAVKNYSIAPLINQSEILKTFIN